MKVFLIEGKDGNIDPYDDVLKRVGMVGRPEVEVLKFKSTSKPTKLSYELGELREAINDNFEKTGKNTLVHCYINSGESRLDE